MSDKKESNLRVIYIDSMEKKITWKDLGSDQLKEAQDLVDGLIEKFYEFPLTKGISIDFYCGEEFLSKDSNETNSIEIDGKIYRTGFTLDLGDEPCQILGNCVVTATDMRTGKWVTMPAEKIMDIITDMVDFVNADPDLLPEPQVEVTEWL